MLCGDKDRDAFFRMLWLSMMYVVGLKITHRIDKTRESKNT